MQWKEGSNKGNALTGQFATPEWVAMLLCSRFRKVPKTVIDLGIGRGSLALAVRERFTSTKLIGIDKYPVPKADRIVMSDRDVQLVRRDISLPLFSTKFLTQFGGADAIVSNPPFTYIENVPAIHELVISQGFKGNYKTLNQRLDLVFLSHAHKLLNQGGELAFILPLSAFAMSKSIENLQAMADNFGLEEIITLPSNIFQSAEVDTAILKFSPKRGLQSTQKFALYNAPDEAALQFNGMHSAANIVEEVKAFAESRRKIVAENTLGGIGGTVARGKHSSSDLLNKGVTHFHTTSFQSYPSAQISFDQRDNRIQNVQDAPALEGDILIARVGTRCLGNAAIVVSGSRYISDCVYRISTPSTRRHQIWEFISSEAGKNWQLSLARGTCAKFITQQDLLSTALPNGLR